MRRGEPVPRAFQAPVDVHASADGQVYLFRGGHEDSGGSSDEEFSLTELRPRSRESGSHERERTGDLLLLERDVAHGDNLNKLALQYGCKVADIKRVNNLIQEQDLYALKSIKIPVQKHSFLTEAGRLGDPAEPDPGPAPGAPPSSTQPVTPNGCVKPHLQGYTDFLKGVDQDIEMLIQSTEAQDEVLLIGQESSPQGAGSGRPSSSGADWGIQWWNAVVVMLLIGVIIPLFCIIYYKRQDSGVSATGESAVSIVNSTSHGDQSNLSALAHTGSLPYMPKRSLL
ncbi:hypothetical protein GJAV_G00227860 [Gymnothorax javanicus]|nr:hypothetical protein GJAV_G00227860 [Gymnothorax javanicus]